MGRIGKLCCCRCCRCKARSCGCSIAAALLPLAVVLVALLEVPNVVTLPVVADDAAEDSCDNTGAAEELAPGFAVTSTDRTFDRIAPVYDLASRWLSLGLSERWHHALVQDCLRPVPGDHILDLASGTADVALLAAAELRAQGRPKPDSVIGVDSSLGMLQQAVSKVENAGLQGSVRFLHGRAEDLSAASDIDSNAPSSVSGIASGSVDKIAMAFGMRHISNPKRAMREIRRVLRRPSGRVCILDTSLPAGDATIAKVVRAILLRSVPIVGRVARMLSPDSSDQEVSQHIEDSVYDAPKPLDLVSSLGREGLFVRTITSFLFGSVHIYEAGVGGACSDPTP